MGLIDYSNGSSSVSPLTTSAYDNINTVQTFLNGLTSKYLLQPQGLGGISGFLFDALGDEEAEGHSDITDHYAEDNSAVQDHIAVNPLRITMRGFVSELTMPAIGGGIGALLSTLSIKMGTVPAYLGQYTPQALQTLQGSLTKAVQTANNYANQVAQYLNQAKSALAIFGNASSATTRQSGAYTQLFSMWQQRFVFSIVTPWTSLDNMAIENIYFIQPKETPSMTDISVTMKQLRFVGVDSAANTTANSQGRAQAQNQPQTVTGSASGAPVLIADVLGNSNSLGLSIA